MIQLRNIRLLAITAFVMFFLIHNPMRSQVLEDFETTPAGWTSARSANNVTGSFIIADPVGTQFQLENDHTLTGQRAYITGQNPNGANGQADVDNGFVVLFSPVYNIAQASTLSLWYFFGEAISNNDAQDIQQIAYSLDGGGTFFLFDQNTDTRVVPTDWRFGSVNIPANSDVQLRVWARDGTAAGDFVEVGIDDFAIVANNNVSISDVEVNENEGQAVFTFTYNGAQIPGGFQVNYATSNNTAIAGNDYTSTTGTLNFNGSPDQELTVSVPITQDGINEPAEYFRMNITSISNNQVQRGWYGTATISPNNLVSISSTTVNENTGVATISFSYFGNTINGGFTVDYNTQDDTAIATLDYQTTSGTLNFTGNSGQVITVNIPIVDDPYGELKEIFTMTASNSSNNTVTIGKPGKITITDTDPSSIPLTIFDQFNGYYGYAVTGGSLRTQNNATDPCAIAATSSNQLTTNVPNTATIEKAYLIWAHSGLQPDSQVSFDGQTINASVINNANNSVNFFSMVGDVTSIVNNTTDLANHSFTFGDLTVDNSDRYCNTTVVLGGWSLFVFYEDNNLPAVRINMYNGFDPEQNSSQSYTLDNFYAIDSNDAKTTVLSWEGDVNLNNSESLFIETSATGSPFKLFGDGDNNGNTINNPFNSTIFDNTGATLVNQTDQYGLDLDTYDISPYILQGESSATLRIDSGQDLVLLNTVVLKVPGNLIVGNIFEDINYPGGAGRDRTTANGIGIDNATVELYREDPINSGNFVLEDTVVSDTNGEYIFGGMANGNYKVRVVSQTIRSNRGGQACTTCLPIQTFRRTYTNGIYADVAHEVGGSNPAAEDVGFNDINNAQNVTSVTISDEGLVDIDFGFNFNTIVNSNNEGQGSLRQFIINSNALNETGLDIEPHPNDASFDPPAGADTSIFMLPTNSDPLGRATDPRYITADGYFDILKTTNVPDITDDNTVIDGKSQTAYQDTNVGTVGAGGTVVGISGTPLPNYQLPEIQVRRDGGNYLFEIFGNNFGIHNLAVNATGILTDLIRFEDGSGHSVTGNIIAADALGADFGRTRHGIRLADNFPSATVDGNYIRGTVRNAVRSNQSTSLLITNNHISNSGRTACQNGINILNTGNGVTIENNLIEETSSRGIGYFGGTNFVVRQNTIVRNGINSTCGDGNEPTDQKAGILINGDNARITQNIIAENGRMGIRIINNGSSGNLVSQNSIYANGTTTNSLGIDLGAIGVTTNDLSDSDAGPNELLNFPIVESATIRGNNLKITGWSRPNTTLEVFLTDINQGTASAGDNQVGGVSKDYGEGQTYLGMGVEGSAGDLDPSSSTYPADADGNTDNTNRFNITIPLTFSIPLGSVITLTATSTNNSTSEFSPEYEVKRSRLITNRRITYRVTPPKIQGPQGTPTNDIVLDFFSDGNGATNFDLALRNNSANPIANYEVFVENVPYATIPSPNFGPHTLQTINNGDGTYSHLFTSNGPPLGANNSGNHQRRIEGGVPSPPGTGSSCGCVTFYKL